MCRNVPAPACSLSAPGWLAAGGYILIMNLAQEFALLAYGDEGSPETDRMRLDHGLGGSLLLELALAERIDIEDKKVVVRDPAPTGDALVDQALARIEADDKPRKPGHWVVKFAKDTRTRTLDQLVADGVLTREQDKVLLVFPRTRYPAPDGNQPEPETATRRRLTEAVSGTGPVEPRTAALCALVAATDLDRKVFRDLDRKLVKARLGEIAEGEWAAAAIKETIAAIQAALVSAVMAASAAAMAAS